MAPKKPAKKSAKKAKKSSKKQQTNAYHFRSALAPLIDDIMKLKELIKERHLEGMKKTPFGTLFEALHEGKMDSESCKKSNDVVMKVLDTYDKHGNGFQIGKQFLKFTAKDISVLFGIPLKDEKEDKRKKKDIIEKKDRPGKLFSDRHFSHPYRITKKDITTALVKVLPSEEEMDVNDSCILVCCLMFCSLFFPYASGALSKRILLSLYEEIETANWPKRILKELLISASQYKAMQSAPGGCTMALLYWLAEHVSITSMKEGKEEEIPRVVRWDVEKIVEAIRDTDFLAIEDSKITENLILSDIEKNIIGGNFEEEEELEEESEAEEEESEGGSEEKEEKEGKVKLQKKEEVEDAKLKQNLMILKGLGVAFQADIDLEESQDEIEHLKRKVADLPKEIEYLKLENEELKLQNEELKSKKAKTTSTTYKRREDLSKMEKYKHFHHVKGFPKFNDWLTLVKEEIPDDFCSAPRSKRSHGDETQRSTKRSRSVCSAGSSHDVCKAAWKKVCDLYNHQQEDEEHKGCLFNDVERLSLTQLMDLIQKYHEKKQANEQANAPSVEEMWLHSSSK